MTNAGGAANLTSHDATDPIRRIDTAPMSGLQIFVVALTVTLNALDGFDVLSISFAAPGIAKAWHVAKDALGVVLSMELVGMIVGSVSLGALADAIGRKATVLGCLMIMATGMFMASRAQGLGDLSTFRLITGLGIGGMLASTNAVAAEFSNAKRRGFSLSLMAIGFPLGGFFGGAIVSNLLKGHDWREVFIFGAAATATLLPVILFLMPESPAYLVARQPANALTRLNRALARMGHATLSALPPHPPHAERAKLADILRAPFLGVTIVLVVVYFGQMFPFYLVLKWSPKLAVDLLKVTESQAAGALVWANLGGALGGGLFGFMTMRLNLKWLTVTAMVLTGAMIILYGRMHHDLAEMSRMAAITQFCGNAGVVGLYSLAARIFPTALRSTGTGLMIGLGRTGAALSPILAGVLMHGGLPLETVTLVMSAIGLSAAALLSTIHPVSWVVKD